MNTSSLSVLIINLMFFANKISKGLPNPQNLSHSGHFRQSSTKQLPMLIDPTMKE